MIYHARQVNGILIVAYIQLSSTLVLWGFSDKLEARHSSSRQVYSYVEYWFIDYIC